MQTKEIKKLNKESITDQIYDILKYYIISEKWKPGYKLPSENELADQFGVSRMSIRVVLQKLNTLRLVETRVGEGTFVKEFCLKSYVDEIAEFFVKPDMLNDINEFRRDFEINILSLAIARADDDDMVELQRVFGQMEQVKDLEAYLEYDFQFHLQICKMSKNVMYTIVYEQITGLMENYFQANMHKTITKFGLEGGLRHGIKSHRELANAIVDRDFEAAKASYLYMIDWVLSNAEE